MPLDAGSVRTVLFVLLVGGVAGLSLGSRYMRDVQGVAKDASRVIKAARPAPPPPPPPPLAPPQAPPQAPLQAPLQAPPPAKARREG